MKVKIPYIYLGISYCIILLLSVNILTRKPVCERIHIDEIDRTKNVVSNEEMAIKIVELYENWSEKYKNHEGNNGSNASMEMPYEIEVIYDEQQYEWIVQFQAIVPDGHSILDGYYDIGVRRDNGMLSSIPR